MKCVGQIQQLQDILGMEGIILQLLAIVPVKEEGKLSTSKGKTGKEVKILHDKHE